MHSGALSQGTCSRCGNYVCDICTEQGHYTECLTCRERGGLGFLFTRDDWTVRGLGGHAWASFKREWLILLVAMALLFVAALILGGAQGIAQVLIFGIKGTQTPFAFRQIIFSSLFGLVLNLMVTPLMVGYIALSLDALRGNKLRLERLFEFYAHIQTIGTLVALFWAFGFAYNLVLTLFFADRTMQELYPTFMIMGLIAAPLLFYVGTGFGFVYAVLADHPELSPAEALRRSWQIATGKRWPIIRIWLVSILVIALGALMCFVPVFVAFPWASLLWAASYLALATPSSSRSGAVR